MGVSLSAVRVRDRRLSKRLDLPRSLARTARGGHRSAQAGHPARQPAPGADRRRVAGQGGPRHALCRLREPARRSSSPRASDAGNHAALYGRRHRSSARPVWPVRRYGREPGSATGWSGECPALSCGSSSRHSSPGCWCWPPMCRWGNSFWNAESSLSTWRCAGGGVRGRRRRRDGVEAAGLAGADQRRLDGSAERRLPVVE
jgi:hypothetical protein